MKTEQSRKEGIIASIVGSHRLEGLELDAPVLKDMELILNDEITVEQAIENVLFRMRNEKI